MLWLYYKVLETFPIPISIFLALVEQLWMELFT